MEIPRNSIHDERITKIFQSYDEYNNIPFKLKNMEEGVQIFNEKSHTLIYIPIANLTSEENDINKHKKQKVIESKDVDIILEHYKKSPNLILITFLINKNWFLWDYDKINEQLILTNYENENDFKMFEKYQDFQIHRYVKIYKNTAQGTSIYLPKPIKQYILDDKTLEFDIQLKMKKYLKDERKQNVEIFCGDDFVTEFKYYVLWSSFEKYAKKIIESDQANEIINAYIKDNYDDIPEEDVFMYTKKKWETIDKQNLHGIQIMIPFYFVWNKIKNNEEKIQPNLLSLKIDDFPKCSNCANYTLNGSLYLLNICCILRRHLGKKFYLSHDTLTVMLSFFVKNGILQGTIFDFLNSDEKYIVDSFYNLNLNITGRIDIIENNQKNEEIENNEKLDSNSDISDVQENIILKLKHFTLEQLKEEYIKLTKKIRMLNQNGLFKKNKDVVQLKEVLIFLIIKDTENRAKYIEELKTTPFLY